MKEIKRIPLEGLFNTRDLGGFPVAGNRHIRPCRLIRSGMLRDMTRQDKETLVYTYGLKNIVDFRTTHEQSESPDPDIPGVQHISNPILEAMTAGITHDEESDSQLSHRIKESSALESIRICMGVKEDYLERVFTIMKQTSGSIRAFLEDKVGLDEAKRDTLKALYLE